MLNGKVMIIYLKAGLIKMLYENELILSKII